MAKSRIPGVLERRHLIEKDLSESQAREIAEAYLSEGRAVDALEFLAKAGATDRLAELRAEAVAGGDAFLFRSVARVMSEPPRPDEWSSLDEAARTAGKERYAADAARQSHHAAKS